MRLTLLLAATAAAATLAFASASAQPQDNNNGYQNGQRDNGQRDNFGPRDPGSYYSQADQNGYYDRSGTYRRVRGDDRNNRQDFGAYYQRGAYEQNCRSGNAAAGTIFGAIAGGLIGSAASHGNGGAVVGGAVLGGLLGNAVSKDISCDDQPYAFQVYSTGLNGDIGRRYDWNHNQARGYFTPTREYRRNNIVCRDFTETSYRGNQAQTRSGTACRAQDGNWRFD